MRNIPLLNTLQRRAGNDMSCANRKAALPETGQPPDALLRFRLPASRLPRKKMGIPVRRAEPVTIRAK